MATHHGNSGTVELGANAVGEIKSWSVDETAETADDSAMGDSWRSHVVGKNSWSGTVECHWDPDDTDGQDALTAGASVTLNLYPEGNSSGADYYSGTATVEGISRSVPQDDIVSVTFTFKGNGALTASTVS